MAESEEELKSLLMRVTEESERAGLKLNIKETTITASGPVVSWPTEGEAVAVVANPLFLALKSPWIVTAARKPDDCFLAGTL